MDRIDCHAHTFYSNIRIIDAIVSPEDLIQRAIDIGLKGIAITDHEVLSAHPRALNYFNSIHEEHPDFKLILGNEIYLVDERPNDQHYHYILLAKNKQGHKILRILSSLAWMNSYMAKGLERVDTLKADLERYVKKYPNCLIASTACIGGELGKKILEMKAADAKGDLEGKAKAYYQIIDFIEWNKNLFGEDFYLEVQPGVSNEQKIVNQTIRKIGELYDIKLIPTSDSHYLKKEDRYVHKAYLNSKAGEREVDAFYADTYLHSNEEMIEKFEFEKEFVEQMFTNSMEIYNKVETYSLFHTQQIPKVHVKYYPKEKDRSEEYSQYKTLSQLFVSDDEIDRYWVNECIDKLKEINKLNETYLSRLEEEAETKAIIGKKLDTNIFAYPVTLQYYINKFWELGSTVGAGRGSSCSGLNHWLLGITQLDPIEWKLPFWRYLNAERAELPDIDVDLAPSKKPAIMNYIKQERAHNFYEDIEEDFKNNLGAVLVATFGTETTKSAILTACRGYRSEDCPDGIDVDTAQYLSSLVPSERGFLWDLHTVLYGDPDKDRQPVTLFINEVNQYPGLLDVMIGIEGVISRRGSHASGVVFADEDPFEFMAYMKTPSGDVITQYDLHTAENCGATKYDFLVTEIQDKIVQTIKLLQNDNQIDPKLSLKEVYDKYLHPSVLPIEDKKVWKAIQEVKVLDLFQFDSAIGAQAAKKIQPSSMLELADANGLMRLMTAEKGAETPMDKYIRFKNNINLWYDEMRLAGLTKEEMITLEPYFKPSYGVPPSQEQLMRMLMDENICHFTLKEANTARKIVGKKQMSKIPELHKQILEQASSPALGKYIWQCGVGPQMGYSFSVIHALAYSFIGFQSAYLATNWNPVYWNTACLIVNSGSLEDSDKGTDYGKIAKAINTIKSHGISISLVDINKSDYGFKPDAENNTIYYGLKALSNINNDTVDLIIKNRPYSSIKDFLKKCPLTKTAVISLIKAGAFDKFMDRKLTMGWYLWEICDKKKKLTLQNMPGLIKYNLLPEDTEERITARRIYEFNRYLKSVCKTKDKNIYQLDDRAVNFLTEIEADNLIDSDLTLKASLWDKIYQSWMDVFRKWIADDKDQILYELNAQIYLEEWNHYAKGTISTWEMQSMCFYYHEHELANVQKERYGIVNFNELENEKIDYMLKRNGRQIPIYELVRIIGTVIAKNDTRHSITLLTPDGVVNVKMTGELYAMYKKQISQVQADGSKKVIEKSWFTRGTMLMLQGFRRDDTFVTKSYSRSLFHQIYKIDSINEDNTIELRHERAQGVAEDEAV